MLNLHHNPGNSGRPAPVPRIPSGQRVYAIGDVHGRLDLLEALADAIEEDASTNGTAESTIVMLGDLIDRGHDSAGVVQFALDWQKRRPVRVLMGNHEEMLLASFTDLGILAAILRCGGQETLLSYGIDTRSEALATLQQVQAAMRGHFPSRHRQFIASFEDRVSIGDYLFVHAGIEPGVPTEEQSPRTLRWIREPFLSHHDPHSHIVVHGHTIRHEVDEQTNRIGIDTGAYCYGRLTALVLEGTQRRFIHAVETDGHIAIETRDAAPA